MGKARFSEDFKKDTVAQITDRGYPVAEVSQRLGVSTHSLYAWKKKYGELAGDDDKDDEIRRLKRPGFASKNCVTCDAKTARASL